MLPGPARYLPQVVLATLFVVGLPALLVTGLQAAASVPAVPAVLLAVALSLAFSRLGAAVWMRRPGSRDIVFGDLMVWGWLRRLRAERRLAEAEALLGEGDLDAGERGELLKSLATGLEARDPYTAGHSGRVARHAEAIAREMGLSRELVAKVRAAAAVHDVGKIRTPRAILTKPVVLDDRERAVMERHAREGARMVAGLGDPELARMVEFHHERLDGSGYPDGLSGGAIPLGARIIAVADTFDAVTSSRPYSPGQRHKRALDLLAAEAPGRLDPRAVAAFRRHYTGGRAVPVGALLTAGPQRLGSWLAGVVQGESAVPLAQGLSALGAAALMGGSLTGGPDERAATERPGAAASAAAAPARLLDAIVRPAADRSAGAQPRRSAPGGPRRRGPDGGANTAPGGGAPGEAPSQGPGGGSAPGSQSPPPGRGAPAPGTRPSGPVASEVEVAPGTVEVGAQVRAPALPLPLPAPEVDLGVKLGLPGDGRVQLPRAKLRLR